MVPNMENILCGRIWCNNFVILDVKGNTLDIKLDIQTLGDFKGLQSICNAFKILFFHTYSSSNSVLNKVTFSELRKQQETPEIKVKIFNQGHLFYE